MHLQMLHSPLRVLKPEEADVVYALRALPRCSLQAARAASGPSQYVRTAACAGTSSA